MMGKYSVETDQYNYKLVRHSTTESGKPTKSTISYHASLQACMRRIVDLEIKEFINEPIEDLVALETKIHKHIDEIKGE